VQPARGAPYRVSLRHVSQPTAAPARAMSVSLVFKEQHQAHIHDLPR